MSNCKGYLKDKYPDLYSTWSGMKTRCTNKKADNYKRYGGIGIRYCKGFDDFSTFKDVVGLRPSKRHTLDRKNSKLNYSCGKCDDCIKNGWELNVRWATPTEQAQNSRCVRMLWHNGKFMTIKDWAIETGINRSTINHRLNYMGWSVSDTLSIPTVRKSRVVFSGKLGNNQYKKTKHDNT